MEWIAIISMTIDHIGAVWFPDNPIWRIVGRLAFPIYAYCIAKGMSMTRDKKKYQLRLLLLALISQIPYTLLFHNTMLNVISSFSVITFALYKMEAAQSTYLKGAYLFSTCILLELLECEYGTYCLLLVAIYRYSSKLYMLIFHILLNAYYWAIWDWHFQQWSIIVTLYFALVQQTSTQVEKRSIPPWVWRSFYPAHLFCLWLLNKALHG